MDGAHTLSIPQTNPLLLEVESESRTEQIRLYPRQNHHVTVGSGQITLRTLLGESYQIFPASKIKRRSDKRSRPENDDATARTAPVEKGLFAVFDIDTDFVRAMIVEVRNQQAEILGMGYHPQNSAHMSEGVITDIPAVIANCHEALLKAEHDADNVMASSVIFSVSGASVKGSSTTVSKQRANPTKPITAEELELLITAAQERLIKAIKEQLSAETGYTNTDIRLTNAAVTSVAIDGQHLFNPIGFRGRHFTLTLFSAFAPLAQLQAFETIAQGLDLTLVTIVTRPYALARCLGMNDQGNGSIIIDIGVDMTSITLLRNGGIEDTRIFAFGLRTFARRIATSRGLPFEEAEHLINAYCNGAMSDTDRTEIQQFLIPDCQTWMDSVELLLEELAKGELLPSTIYMIGEGATMPDLYHHLETFPWTGRLPFSRSPMIREASPHLIPNILDPKGKITSKQDLTLIALAYQAIELTEENNALERALDRVINTLEI
jgi:cell division protein FtsA